MITAQKFDSLIAFSEYLKNTPANCLSPYSGGSRDEGGPNDEFYHTKNYDEAENYMLSGWDSGTAKVTEIMTIQAAGVAEVKRLMLDVVGVIPCVQAYLSGSPRNMINIKRRNIARPVLRLLYTPCASSAVSADDILKAGATMFNTILGIEAAGVRVELWAGSVAGGEYNSSNRVANFVKIKSADQPVNIMQMTYPVVNPSFQRRHSFAFRERQNLKKRDFGNYGCTCLDHDKINECAENCGLQVDKILTFYDIQNKSEKQIADLIK